MKKSILSLWVLGSLSSFSSALANEPMPKCFDGHQQLISVMNEQVVGFKKTLPNLRKVQVLVKATLVQMMPNVSNAFGIHEHFIISLGEDASNPVTQIEIADSINGYNSPTESDLSAGPIYLCGEYSTTNANGYPKITTFTPSSTGAMIHWTHQNNTDLGIPAEGHPNGWIYANGKVFGQPLSGANSL